MLRIAGAVCILIGAVILSAYTAEIPIRRLREQEAYLAFLQFVREQISCFCTPTEQIYLRCDEPRLLENGFLPRLRDGAGYEEALRASFHRLTPASYRLLLRFGEGIGRSYREEQLRLCDESIRTLSEQTDRVREEAPNKQKVYRTLTLCCALMALLLLL